MSHRPFSSVKTRKLDYRLLGSERFRSRSALLDTGEVVDRGNVVIFPSRRHFCTLGWRMATAFVTQSPALNMLYIVKPISYLFVGHY